MVWLLLKVGLIRAHLPDDFLVVIRQKLLLEEILGDEGECAVEVDGRLPLDVTPRDELL